MKSHESIVKDNQIKEQVDAIIDAIVARDINRARKALTAILSLDHNHQDIPVWNETLQLLQKYDWVSAFELNPEVAVFIKDEKAQTLTPYLLRELLVADMKGHPVLPLERIQKSVTEGHIKILSERSGIAPNVPVTYN